MGYFISMFFCNLLIPMGMIVAGTMLKNNVVKNVNSLLGYRTPKSKRNTETWRFSQNYCGKLWIKLGMISLIVSAIIQLLFIGASEDTIGYYTVVLELVQVVLMLSTIPMVERAIDKVFDDNGNKR